MPSTPKVVALPERPAVKRRRRAPDPDVAAEELFARLDEGAALARSVARIAALRLVSRAARTATKLRHYAHAAAGAAVHVARKSEAREEEAPTGPRSERRASIGDARGA